MPPLISPSLTAALIALAAAALPPHARSQPALDSPSPDEIIETARRIVSAADTAYVSDYVSFAGADASGRVAFALDTNRGRAGRAHQAEHFVAMYDERTGWVDLEGYTDFENTGEALVEHPDSPYFEFVGAPYAIESLRSDVNGLRLDFGPLEPRLTERSERTLFSMASAPATLTWNDRRIEGRVIYEFLAMRDENRLAPGVSGLFGILTGGPDFQGLYLATENGDFYAHRAPVSAAASAGSSPLMAFRVEGGRNVPVENIGFEVTRFDAAFGFYRWPASWNVSWRSDCGAAQLSVRSLDHDTQTNWITGGFAMRVVEGEIICGSETTPVFGFAELIR